MKVKSRAGKETASVLLARAAVIARQLMTFPLVPTSCEYEHCPKRQHVSTADRKGHLKGRPVL